MQYLKIGPTFRSDVSCFETLFEYRTAKCRLDYIDLPAFTAFHLSLDGDFYTAELLCYIDRLMCLGVKTQVF